MPNHKIVIYEEDYYKNFAAEWDKLIKYEFFVDENTFNSDEFKKNRESFIKDKEKAHLESLKTKNRYVFKKDSLFGVKELSGKVISPPVYYRFNKTEQGIFYAYNKNKGCWVLFNKALYPLTNCEYSDLFCKDFNSNKCFIEKANKFGTIDTTGKEMIPPIYSNFKYIGDSLLLAENGEKKDILTYDNRMIFSGKNKKINDTYCFNKYLGFETYCRFEENGYKGVVDNTGKIIFPPEYDDIKIASFNSEMGEIFTFILKTNDKWDLWYNGQIILKKVDFINPFIEEDYIDFKYDLDFLIFKKYNNYGIICNTYNQLEIKQYKNKIFKYIRSMPLEDYKLSIGRSLSYNGNNIHSKIIYYKENNLWGICDIHGEIILEAKYNKLFYFGTNIFTNSNKLSWDHTANMFLALKNGYWGIIDIKNDTIFDFKWTKINIKEFSEYIIVKSNEHYGLIDNMGNLYLNTRYDQIKRLSFNTGDEYATIKINGKYGLIDLDKELVIHPDDTINNLSAKLLNEYNDAYSVSITLKGKKLLNCNYDDIKTIEFGKYKYFKIRKDSCWKLIKPSGKEILDSCCKSISIIEFQKENYFKIKYNKYWTILSAKGKPVFDSKFKSIIEFGNTLYAKNEKDKWGSLISENGNCFKYIYDEISIIQDKYANSPFAKIKLNGKYAFLDKKCRIATGFDYDELDYLPQMSSFQNKYYKVKKNGKWGVVQIIEDNDKYEVEVVLDFKYDSIVEIRNLRGYLKIKSGEFWGMFNNKFDIIIEPNFRYLIRTDIFNFFAIKNDSTCGEFSKGKFKFLNNNVDIKRKKEKIGFGLFKQRKECFYGIVDSKDSLILDYKYFDIEKFNKKSKYYPYDMAKINENGLYGYILKDGTFLVTPQFEVLKAYQEDMARVKKNNKWGFINVKGKIVIPLIYDLVEPFTNGKSRVLLNGERFYIDKNGIKIHN